MRRGSFVFNGLTSQEINAVITNWVDVTQPARNVTLNSSIVGLDRALAVDNGNYANREFSITIGIRGNSVINRDTLLFTLDTGDYLDACFYFDENYNYQIIAYEEIQTTRPVPGLDYREITIKINAAPFKYLKDVANVNVSGSATLTNPLKYPAKPLITINGSGDITLTVNSNVIQLHNVDGQIVLDSGIQDTYQNKSGTIYNLNSNMSHSEYPVLKSGENKISLSTGTAVVEPRWRTR